MCVCVCRLLTLVASSQRNRLNAKPSRANDPNFWLLQLLPLFLNLFLSPSLTACFFCLAQGQLLNLVRKLNVFLPHSPNKHNSLKEIQSVKFPLQQNKFELLYIFLFLYFDLFIERTTSNCEFLYINLKYKLQFSKTAQGMQILVKYINIVFSCGSANLFPFLTMYTIIYYVL